MDRMNDKDRLNSFIDSVEGKKDDISRKIKDKKCPICQGTFILENDIYTYNHYVARKGVEKLNHMKDSNIYFILAICNQGGNTLSFSLKDMMLILKREQRLV